MKYGWENNKFFVEYGGCSREPKSLREEAHQRAVDIYNVNPKVMLCLSSGLDSQIALESFFSQGIPLECAFLRMGGYNDNELENVKVLERKWGFTAHVVDINPNDVREELESLKTELDAHANHCLQYKFVKSLPEDYDIIQVLHDPWTISSKKLNQHFLFHGYYDPEIARHRVLKKIERSGEIHMFGDSHEFFLSCIQDPIFEYFFDSWIYFEDNGLKQYGNKLPSVLRYEYYIKPMLYSKHWGKNLIYFPKFSGYENIEWLMKEVRVLEVKNVVLIERNELLKRLSTIGAAPKKYYQAPPFITSILRAI